MPSQKGLTQAITWLKSKMLDRDSLDGINAEVCLNVIKDLQQQCETRGQIIHRLKQKDIDRILSQKEELVQKQYQTSIYDIEENQNGS